MSRRKAVLIGLATTGVLVGVVAWFILFRTVAFTTWLVTRGVFAPDLIESPPIGPGVTWYGDYFAVQPIDAETFAIGAPPHPYRAMSYLIIGRDRAVLFDTGPGLHDIHRVVSKLTDRPVIAAASHVHYDHVGDLDRFSQVALADHPELRALADASGRVSLPTDMHLAEVENLPTRPFTVTAWWADEQVIDLGGRQVRVLFTPGHTESSMMLFDEARGQLYTGDFIYFGDLFAMLHGAHIGHYRRTTRRLLARVGPAVRLYPGHQDLDKEPWSLKTLDRSDLADLLAALDALHAGEAEMTGVLPPTWRVNDRMQIITTYPWNMDWSEE